MPTAGGGDQRVADLVDGRRRPRSAGVGRRARRPRPARSYSGIGDAHVVAADLRPHAWPAAPPARARAARVGVVERVARRRSLRRRAPAVDPALQLEGGRADVELRVGHRSDARVASLGAASSSSLPPANSLSQRRPDPRRRQQHGVLEVVGALLAQLLAQRAEQDRPTTTASVSALVRTKASSSRPRRPPEKPAAHGSRKRYPRPGTVRIRVGCSGLASSFSRRWRMWTSIARGSR